MAFGDPILGEPELMVAEDALAFAGIAPPALRVYAIETHLAEKLHAYMMPRARPNSRVKDLWAAPYAIIAREDQLRWSTLVDAFEAACAFLDPVLTGSGGAVWDPTAWRWTVPASPPNPEQD